MEAASALEAVVRETGFSKDAVESMLQSLRHGHGTMAQFDHPQFGGHGQWMRGGMIMLSASSDSQLKRRVDELCVRLSELMARREVPATDDVGGANDNAPWPAAFGAPSTSGSQNGVRYAWFAGPRRLVIDDAGRRSVYDTADHRISGVAQQQGAAQSLNFSSEAGLIALEELARVHEHDPESKPVRNEAPSIAPMPRSESSTHSPDPLDTLERLAALRDRGVISDADYATKKAELLSRI